MNVADYMFDLETRLMEIVARNLVKGNQVEQQIRKLGQLGAVNNEVVTEIKKAQKEIKKVTKVDIETASIETLNQVSAKLPKNYADKLAFTPGLQKKVDAWTGTATDALNTSMSTLAKSAGQAYVNAANRANLMLITGNATLEQAIKEAVKCVPSDRFTVFFDKSGRAWSPEGYARMVIRTNQRRVVSATMEDAGNQLGTDLVEISSHIGARPNCAPYQGRIYSRSGQSDKYPPLSSTSYGEVDGIDGINCGHVLYPFIEGLSKQTFKPYPEKENDKAYEESQEQRKLEAQVRNAKRQASVLEAGGNTIDAAAWRERAREGQANLRKFIDATGRTRQYQRERVFTS